MFAARAANPVTLQAPRTLPICLIEESTDGTRALPIYEYRCTNGHTFEVLQSMSDDPVAVCEVCSSPVERVFHPVAVHFKGSGFYTTDYGRNRSGGGSGGSGDDSKGESAKSESGKSESSGGDSSSGDSSKSGSKESTAAKPSDG